MLNFLNFINNLQFQNMPMPNNQNIMDRFREIREDVLLTKDNNLLN